MPAPEDFYKQKLLSYQQELTIKRANQKLFSLLRLLVFVGLLYFLYRWFDSWQQFWLIMALADILVFITLIRISISLSEKTDWLLQLLFINQNELDVSAGKPNQFNDGAAFGINTRYSADLDIFGPRSLYHLLNRTNTTHGSAFLAGLFQKPLISKEEIRNYQSAIAALAGQPDLRQSLIAHGRRNTEEKGNLNSVIDWLEIPSILLSKKWVQLVRIILPVLNILLAFYYLSTNNYLPLLGGIFISWCITGMYAKYIMQQHLLISRKQAVLEQYAGILKKFADVDNNGSSTLEVLKKTAVQAGKSMDHLSRLSSLFDQRLNVLVYVVLNSLLMYDLQCILSLEKWKVKHQNHFRDWIECVGEIEAFVSMAGFKFNNPTYNFPQPVNGKARVEGIDICHPLIMEGERVGNPLTVGRQSNLLLITGSNMSGKTTYLRTVGVNLVLAQCGGPVSAKEFVFTPMQILTSIRVSDSLQEHTSYFMAELKQLRYIIDQLDTGLPALVLVDEILRGTNSEDKNHGSEAFIRKLLKYDAVSLFATHDLALGELEKELPGKVHNCCFESNLVNGELVFDYRLRDGLAKNRNASYLMEKMGII